MQDSIVVDVRTLGANRRKSTIKEAWEMLSAIPKGVFGMLLPVALFAAGIMLCAASQGSVTETMEGFSYSTLALIVSMEVFTNLMAKTGFMEWVAVKLAIITEGRQKVLLAALSGFMFLVSSTMNNITAVLCVLPCVFVLFKVIVPDKRYLSTFFAVLLATSNLGGAASGVGDLPAILIMNTGIVSFTEYTIRAFPCFAATTAAIIAFWTGMLRVRGVKENPDATRLAINVLEVQYRYVKVDFKTLIPLFMVLIAMLCCWIAIPQSLMGPEVIAVVGCITAVALYHLFGGEPSQVVNMGSIFTIASFLFVASAIASTGVLFEVAESLRGIASDDKTYLLLVLVLTSLISGLVGAGPAAAVCLPIITELASVSFSANCPFVMVAYGAAICAGSSLFMWSGTAGFILSGKVGGAQLSDATGGEYSWSIADYFPYGLVNYIIQMSIALAVAFVVI